MWSMTKSRNRRACTERHSRAQRAAAPVQLTVMMSADRNHGHPAFLEADGHTWELHTSLLVSVDVDDCSTA